MECRIPLPSSRLIKKKQDARSAKYDTRSLVYLEVKAKVAT